MEQGLRSNGVFTMKKSPTGGLIIKKKLEKSSEAIGTLPKKDLVSNEGKGFGIGTFGLSKNSFEANRRGVLPRDNRLYSSSAMHGEGNLGNRIVGRNVVFDGERSRNFNNVEFNETFGAYGKGVLGNNRIGRSVEFEGERIRKYNNMECVKNVKMYGEGVVGSYIFGQKMELGGEGRRKFNEVEFDKNVGTYDKGIVGNNKFGPIVKFEDILGSNRNGRKPDFEGEGRKKFGNMETDKNLGMRGKGIVGSNKNGRIGEFEDTLGNDRFGWRVEFEGERRRRIDNMEFDENVGTYGKGIVGNSRNGRKREFEGILGNNINDQKREFEGEKRRKFDENVGMCAKHSMIIPKFGQNGNFGGNLGNNKLGRDVEFEGEKKRKFDNVEINENIGTYGKRMRKDDIDDRYANRRELEPRSSGLPLRQQFPVHCDKPIRVQGKNGVLKVMVNKSKNAQIIHQFYGKYIQDANKSGPSVCSGQGQKNPKGPDSSIQMDNYEPELCALNMQSYEYQQHDYVNEDSDLGIDISKTQSVTPAVCSDSKLHKTGPLLLEWKKSEFKSQKKSSKRDNSSDLKMDGGGSSSKPKSSYNYELQTLVKRDSNLETDINKNALVIPVVYSGAKLYKEGNSLPKGDKSEIELQKKSSKNANSGHSKLDAIVLAIKTKAGYDNQHQYLDRNGPNLEVGINKKAPVMPILCSHSNLLENGNSLPKEGKSEIKLQNKSSNKANRGVSKTDGSDSLLKSKPSYDYQSQNLVIRGSNLEIGINKHAPVTPAVCSDAKLLKKGNSLLKGQITEINQQSSFSERATKNNSVTEDSHSLSKRERREEQICSSSRGVKGDDKTPLAKQAVFVAHEETKVKRSNGAEKQEVREKIKQVLLKAGWTIDYKPRKNKNYHDMVYVNPAGSTYWSIIKAYEAFKKQDGEGHVPEEMLNKLTRQTMKKKQEDSNIEQKEEATGKSGEDVAMEEAEEDSEDDLNDEKRSFPAKQKDSNSQVITERKPENDNNDVKQIFSSTKNGKPFQRNSEKPSIGTNSQKVHERKTQQISHSTLLVRSSIKGSKSQTDDYVPYAGNKTVLIWLIDFKIVEEGAQVQYMNQNKTKIMLKGWISKDGIHCECCDKIISVSKFEAHTGSQLRKPYEYIYLENGVSLLQCQIDAWNKQDIAKRCGFYTLDIEDVDENDDVCGLCGDGGNLMCCDGCPSTFHQSCIGIKTLPLGDWHCPNCTCKFCERSSAHGNTLLTCRLCERTYHESCKEDVDVLSDGVDCDSSFCGMKCKEVYNQLQKLLEGKHELEGGFSWSLIHRTDIDTDTTQLGFPQKVECNSKLAIALSVIEECFLPIHDRRSGINIIHNVVYNRGSNYRRLNHSGFYTAILERGDDIIAAAAIRIHGTKLAEMPFIGTRQTHRRQGMCRRLLSAIESALSSLKVGQLIIPVDVVADDMDTWTGVFGFNPLEKSLKKELRSLNILVFPKTELLQKILVEQTTTGEHLYVESGAKSSLSKVQQLCKPKARKGTRDSKFGHASDVGDCSKLKSHTKTTKRTATKISGLRINVCEKNATSNISSDVPSESYLKAKSREENSGVGFDAHSAHLKRENPEVKVSNDGHPCEDGTTEDVNEVVEPSSDKETNL